jgi:hypothetical protein
MSRGTNPKNYDFDNNLKKMLNSHPACLNQVLDTPDVQVQEPLVVVKKHDRV